MFLYDIKRLRNKARSVSSPNHSYPHSFFSMRQQSKQALLHDNNVVSNEGRALLSYYYNHTIHRKDNPNLNPPLTIRDEAMNNFIRLTSIKNPHIIPVTSDNIQFRLGDNVVVKVNSRAFVAEWHVWQDNRG